MAALTEKAIDLIVEYWRVMDCHDVASTKRNTVSMLVTGEMLDCTFANLRKALRELNTITSPRVKREGSISNEMITKARMFPFTQLLEFKHNSAMCPLHQGKTPALRLYPAENRVYCFACQRGWDPIAWVRETEGRSFVEAVRVLQ